MSNKPKGIYNLLHSISKIEDGDTILIITDDNKLEIGTYVYEHVKNDYETSMIVMQPTKGHGDEPTEVVAAALKNADVAFGATTMSLFHSKARRDASKGKRLKWVGLQDYSLDMFTSGGLLANFDEIHALIDGVVDQFQGKTFTLLGEGGTNMVCSVENRKPVIDYGTARCRGDACFPPNAEIALGPVEGTANGVLVIDGSIPHPELNLIEEPITCHVKDGYITEIEGGKEAEILKRILESYNDPTVYNIAELGLGMNPCNKLCGRMAPDEGSFGNIHVGIGKNLGFGGHVDSPLHLDMVIKTVTCIIDGRIFMKDGILLAK